MGNVTYYPTGVSLYKPEKCCNGYTLYPLPGGGAVIIDMHGNELRRFENITGFPLKMLPGGHILGSSREIKNGLQDMEDLIEINWDGEIVWKYNSLTTWPQDGGEGAIPTTRQHHDFQREGNPVGYFSTAECEPATGGGKTMILCHEDVYNSDISDKTLLDDTIIEVDQNGTILWRWRASDHIDEFGFSPQQRQTIRHWPNYDPRTGASDWFHINCASWLGGNPWYENGDQRFHPDNIIFGSRESCMMGIISHETGKIVWRLGPDFTENDALKKIGWIIGQHHVHMIPKGLPGEGNILLFDNGGAAGYAEPTPFNPTGNKAVHRDYSRILEINPINFEIVWQYSAAEAGYFAPLEPFRFYSKLISSAQRLPNGNTVITEGVDGRIFEVTREHELVWEFTNPVFNGTGDGSAFQPPFMNMIYRSYRVPYEWIPQLTPPGPLKPIAPVHNSKFRVPGAPCNGPARAVAVKASEPNVKQPPLNHH